MTKIVKEHTSSNINEDIRQVLNFFFFHGKILHAQKAQKEYKAPKSTKRHRKHPKKLKAKNANKRTKIKNALKNI